MVGPEKNKILNNYYHDSRALVVNTFYSILRILQLTVLFTFCLLLSAGAVETDTNSSIVFEPRPLSGFDAISPEIATVVPLEELEAFVSNAPEILVAAAELEETLYRLEQEQALSGLKINASAGGGHFREAITDHRVRNYDRARVSLGLHYPLLGTLARERINVLKAEGRTWESRQRIKIIRLKSLQALRSQYILLWGSQQKLKLCKAFLTDEHQVDTILQKRKEVGLLLEADRGEFMTAFFLVRRDAANLIAIERRALKNIRMLTHEYAETIIASTPSLPFPCLDENVLRAAVIDRHPELILLRGLIEEQLGVISLSHHSDIQANVSMIGNGDIDYPSEQEGYGLSVQFNMDLPWEFAKAERAQKNAEQASLKKLQYKLDMVSAQLLIDAEDYLQRYYAALENKRFAAQRAKTALETVRERSLRQAHIPGDVFEQLQASRFAYYRTAMDYVDSEIIELQSRVRLLAFHEEGARTQETAMQFDSVINENFLKPLWSQTKTDLENEIPVLQCNYRNKHTIQMEGYGVYVWNSRKMFELAQAGEGFWEKIKEDKINRILLSFDARQLKELAQPMGEKRLRSFILKAKDWRISIGLLLGEPTWILPAYRENLLQIINKVQGMGVDLIHLDLEPNQLEDTKLPIQYLLAQLLRTVQVVSRITPLPLEIDLHPRYLDAKANKFCFGCGLENLDSVGVTLMVYVKNPHRVADIVQSIMDEYPKISFSIAQSVEPLLSKKESYADVSKQDFHDALTELNDLTNNRLQSIYIQSWQDYMDMHNAN